MIYPLFEDMLPRESNIVGDSIHAVTLSRRAIERARDLGQILYECGDDPEFWAETVGYEVYEVDNELLAEGMAAALIDGVIALRRGMTDTEKIVSIGHEIYHHEFHGAAVAHRDLDGNSSFEESEAECFGVLLADFNFWKYESIDEFRYSTPLTGRLRDLREALFYQIHQ